jgi:hypothetical protein
MTEPRAQAIDDKASLDDLKEVERAVMEARHALQFAMVGQGSHHRETFVFHVGMARDRLSRIISRIYGQDPPPIERGDAP